MPATSKAQTTAISLRLPRSLRRQFRRVCELREVSVNAKIVQLMTQWLGDEENQALLDADVENREAIIADFAREHGLLGLEELLTLLEAHHTPTEEP